MNLLLDTNALVWASDENRLKNLGKNARRLIESSGIVYFSAVSIAELQIKHISGKLKEMPNAQSAVAGGLLGLNFKTEHAQVIENFPSLVRHDPFDRMIIAQAYSENLLLLTADKTLLSLGLNYVIDARV